MTPTQEQLARVKRFLRRIEPRGATDDDQDDLWSFFQHCWHLKDWLMNDLTVPERIRNSVESEVEQYESLMICADLANRTKHLTLRDRSKRRVSTRWSCRKAYAGGS